MHVASVQPKETFLQGHACMPVAKVQPKDPVCLQIYACMHVASVQPKSSFQKNFLSFELALVKKALLVGH